MAVKLTEEQKKAIDSYGDEIYSAKDSLDGIGQTIKYREKYDGRSKYT